MRGSEETLVAQASEVITRSNPVLDGPLLDAAGARAFRLAAVRLAREVPRSDGATEAAHSAAQALTGLARSNDEAALRRFLQPDPRRYVAAWTVACYQIGDLTPCALLDFASPVDAVASLVDCNEPSHVAAELVASTPSGTRWTALIRTGQTVSFQLPDGRSASDATGDEPGERSVAAEHWRDQLRQWATDPGEDDWAPPVNAPRSVKRSAPPNSAGRAAAGNASIQPAQPAQPAVDVSRDDAAGSGDDLEQALRLVIDALRNLDTRTRAGGAADGQVLARLDALDRRMSDFQASLETAFERRIQALASYSVELTRAFAAQQAAAMARVEVRLDELMAKLPGRVESGSASSGARQLTTAPPEAPVDGGDHR